MRSGSVEVAALLLGRGADINAQDRDQWTVLMQAAFRGSQGLVDFLLAKGTSLPATTDRRIFMLQTFAASGGLVDLMNRLVATGANYTWKDEAGGTLMHKAAVGNAPKIIETLAKAGLSASEANAIGWTPLHYAAEQGRRAASRRCWPGGRRLTRGRKTRRPPTTWRANGGARTWPSCSQPGRRIGATRDSRF
jgi:ankyrin repeat protein